MKRQEKIVIVGGGVSGLIASILLSRLGFDVTVVEKKKYPFHRVCGEYVSNEVLPFLNSLGIYPDELNPSRISRLTLRTIGGNTFSASLPLGGFGISRYKLDDFLYRHAVQNGVGFLLGEKVNEVIIKDEAFQLTLSDSRKLFADLVIASFGKRSNLDQKLNRDFFTRRSPYLGVKYHIKTDFPTDLIRLDNFDGGYCGLVKIEDDKYCLCYLSGTKNLKKFGSIAALEEEVLFKNAFLKRCFLDSVFLFKKPEVINEISFEQKSPVENHILFCGDAAGMITPLCGNGMAMGIRSAKTLADTIQEFSAFRRPEIRANLERAYTLAWKKEFSIRLKLGRWVQTAFLHPGLSNFAVKTFNRSRTVSKYIIDRTHGEPFL